MKKILFLILILGFFSMAQAGPRYVSIAPSTTEILFALGLDHEIVGVSSYCNYPLQAKKKEKVGSFSQPDMEKILFLKPDYIFCTGLEQAQVILKLRQVGLKVFVCDPSNIGELITSIKEIGKFTHKEKEAQLLVENMQSRLQVIKAKITQIHPEKRKKLFIEIWNDPLMTVGKGSFVDELVTLAGGINISGDTKRAFSRFSPEEVIKRDPDCIIFTYMDPQAPKKFLEARIGWKEISAVKNNQLYNDINPDIILRPGPRVIEGIEEIHKRLYH